MENNKYLTSLALFRELYDNKKNIYDVLSEFIRYTILTKNIHQFNTREITDLLNEMYDFSVPEAVVKSALKNIKSLTKENGIYLFNADEKDDTSSFSAKYEDIKLNNDYIIEELAKYVNSQKNKSHSYSKDDIADAFCSYIINEEDAQECANLISAFIIKNKGDVSFTKKLNIIKEGVILYSGIKYTSNLNEIGSWKTRLSVYLETEILFSLAGFNGDLYKTLFNDLYNLAQEINEPLLKRNKPGLICFKYFGETLNEIDQFFSKAQYILENNEKIDPSRPAMVEILNGCKTPSDVILKKAKFFELLKNKNIELDDKNYYETKNHTYNIEDLKTINDLKNENPTIRHEEVEHSLKILNYINILRRGDSKKGFENIEFILLTGKNITQQIAIVNIKEDGSVPLATSINWLTNRFWFKLNKGFGNGSTPKSFDIITKAQTVLSSQVNNSIAAKFYDLKKESRAGVLQEGAIVAAIAGLREGALKPEEINENNAEDVLNEISEEQISHFAREHDLLKTKHYQNLREITNNQKIISEKNIKISELQEYKDKLLLIEKRKKVRNKFIIVIVAVILVIFGTRFLILKNVLWGAIAIFSSILTILLFFGVDNNSIKDFFIGLYRKITTKK